MCCVYIFALYTKREVFPPIENVCSRLRVVVHAYDPSPRNMEQQQQQIFRAMLGYIPQLQGL